MQSGLKLNRPMKIFITHLHGDHILGLPGLLQTFSLLGRDNPLEIYGPRGIAAYIRAMIRTVRFHLAFPLTLKEITEGTIVHTQRYRVECAKANHSVKCFSYAFIQGDRPGKFHPEKAIALGVKPGPMFSKLQQGNDVRVRGRVVRPSQVMEDPRPGVKIVFSGDTYYSKKLVTLARSANVLVHECTFDNSLAEKAKGDKHSTPEIATRVAIEADVGSLFLNHITQRYPNPGILLAQAVQRFPKTVVAEDLTNVKL